MGQSYPQISVYAFCEWLRANDMHDTLVLLNHVCKDAPNWAYRDLNKMKQWASKNHEKAQIFEDLVTAYKGLQTGSSDTLATGNK